MMKLYSYKHTQSWCIIWDFKMFFSLCQCVFKQVGLQSTRVVAGIRKQKPGFSFGCKAQLEKFLHFLNQKNPTLFLFLTPALFPSHLQRTDIHTQRQVRSSSFHHLKTAKTSTEDTIVTTNAQVNIVIIFTSSPSRKVLSRRIFAIDYAWLSAVPSRRRQHNSRRCLGDFFFPSPDPLPTLPYPFFAYSNFYSTQIGRV